MLLFFILTFKQSDKVCGIMLGYVSIFPFSKLHLLVLSSIVLIHLEIVGTFNNVRKRGLLVFLLTQRCLQYHIDISMLHFSNAFSPLWLQQF